MIVWIICRLMIVRAYPLRFYPYSMFGSIDFEKEKLLLLGFVGVFPNWKAKPCNRLEWGFQIIR